MFTGLKHSSHLLAATLITFLLLPLSSFAQEKQNRILEKIAFPNEPVEIVSLRAGKQVVSFNNQFAANEYWLKNFSVSLKNISDKPILHVEVVLTLTEMLIEGAPLSFSLLYGEIPDSASTPHSNVRRIELGETINLSVSDSLYKSLNAVMPNNADLSVNKVGIRIGFVLFEDDTAWSTGLLHRRDPSNPQKWNAIHPEKTIREFNL